MTARRGDGGREAREGFAHLYPFRSRYLERGGLRMHYLDEGRGNPVLMVHGNPTWSFYYRQLVRDLAPGHRVVVPDHIGCGFSDKPPPDRYGYRLADRVADLEGLLEHLGIERDLTLVVHDWGGMIGMACAALRPERIRRLVVLNTAAFPPPPGWRIPWRLRLVRDVPPLAVPAVLGLNLFSVGALFMAARRRLPPDVRRGLTAPYDRWAHRIATLRFVQDIPLRPGDDGYGLVAGTAARLARLRDRPMLICWGRHDFVFDAHFLAEWRRRFPRAECTVYENAGHYILEDEPAAVSLRVRDFLRRHPL